MGKEICGMTVKNLERDRVILEQGKQLGNKLNGRRMIEMSEQTRCMAKKCRRQFLVMVMMMRLVAIDIWFLLTLLRAFHMSSA